MTKEGRIESECKQKFDEHSLDSTNIALGRNRNLKRRNRKSRQTRKIRAIDELKREEGYMNVGEFMNF